MDRPKRTPKPRVPYTPAAELETAGAGTGIRRRRRHRCWECGAAPPVARLSRTVDRANRSVRHSCADCVLKQKLDKFCQRGQGARPAPSAKERRLLEAEFDEFASLMRQHLDDPLAAQLFCPVIRKKPCACIQRYVLGNEHDSHALADCLQRGRVLLDLRKRAEQLRKLKFLDRVDEVSGALQPEPEPAAGARPGLGGGHRKNPAYERLVLQQRLRLKEELSLCETAAQRVLLYSNCFLHRRLRTDPLRQNRIQKTNEKRHKVLLKPISELSAIACCSQGCTRMADTYSSLVSRWRGEAGGGQRAARTVLAQMLTPCAAGKRNCLAFVHLVTGCSDRTMMSVLVQLEDSRGDRTPPVHGLKTYWARRKAQNGLTPALSGGDPAGPASGGKTPPAACMC
ncbi:uncharacterized protein LOC119100131 [Pollicipes pollicipes]|uniref:uncharacterized protein LOC119100131 n=1 Tax=Pollicipes pollicipes TaxID=41117 RepID=UPI0018852D99|nr:uncharacterized protein LOC119100131 [Pollicipes pollicipes]